MNRRILLLPLATGLLVVAYVVSVVLSGRAVDQAAADFAQRYVDLVAEGGEQELESLWGMTVTKSPGALRAAGEMLVEAEQRIEVLAVGEPRKVARVSVPYRMQFDHFVEAEVRYRLAGEEHTWPLTLGRLLGESGRDVGDWRVVGPMLGSVDWGPTGLAVAPADVHLGSTRQVRRPRLGAGDESTQPLHPAVYRGEWRMDPWFVTEPTLLAVAAGDPVTAPDAQLLPTPTTKKRVRRLVREGFDFCGADDLRNRCPVGDLLRAHGIDDRYDGSWWGGLTTAPAVDFDGTAITLTGGTLRLRGPDGEFEVSFSGTGRYLLDNQSWQPFLVDVELVEES